MKPERWQQLDQLLEAALERPPAERDAFLAEACADDEILRQEVESLLHADARAESFIETPALPLAVEVLAQQQARTSVNQQLGHYQILAPLGAGGMGEVFLAQDARLGRKVALKLLPARFTTDAERVRRFEQEGRAASALNHPHIITIHDIGHANGIYFIATELIEGQTLRRRLAAGPLPLREAIEVAQQATAALAAAHAAGIIHRDIKPENIMLREDGYVKVLDFGLAKLTEQRAETMGCEAATRDEHSTAPGAVLGTLHYMSPEQARGQRVDARTDIFSLGVVLYEMLAGHSPFAGATMADVIAAILEREPPPLARHLSEAPRELERIVSRMLHKDREARYQASKDLLKELQDLKEELSFAARLKKSAETMVPPASGNERELPPTSGTTHEQVAAPTGAEAVPNGSRRYQLSAVGALLVLVAALVAGWLWLSNRAMPHSAIRSLAVLPLKSLGANASDDYLSLGIADALIRRMSQTGKLTVRPTSAVRRYLKEETDALTAAQQLAVDVVLEGSVQRTEDRLRVGVNLLRTSDGASLWSDNFDLRMADIFTVQDTVAQQVAAKLRLQLEPAQQARLSKHSTSNPIAYEFYLKGVYSFDQREGFNKPQMEATIEFFRKAIEADVNYALAHAQLARAYAWKALFIAPTEPVWAEYARTEIKRALTLDPQLAETHIARHLLLWSAYEGFQNEAAVRELLLAQQLNPNVGQAELASLYQHLGLEDLGERELKRALEVDPTSEAAKSQVLNLHYMAGKYDEWFAAHQKLYPNKPVWAWYWLGKGRLDEAQKAIAESSALDPEVEMPRLTATLLALKGDFRAAEGRIPEILSKNPRTNPNRHHAAYDIACIYALGGKSDEAVKWLREAATTGYPCYPRFERDAYLNRIRQAPEFIQFMAETKARWESYRREFE